MATGPPFHRQLRRRYTARRRQNLTNIKHQRCLQLRVSANKSPGQQIVTLESVLQMFLVLPKTCISQRNTLKMSESQLLGFSSSETKLWVGIITGSAGLQQSETNKYWMWLSFVCLITHDTTVCHAQNTFQLESSTSTMLQHLASQSAQPLPRVCKAPRVATDRAALKTSNACSHCAAATQAVMTVPKDTRFNCRVAERAVSWKEIGTMVWKTYWQCYLYV